MATTCGSSGLLICKSKIQTNLHREMNYISPPHAIKEILKQPPEQWLSNTCLTHYQDLLLSTPTNLLTAKYSPKLSLLTSMGTSPWKWWDSWPRNYLSDHPILDTEVTWYTDEQVYTRQRYGGEAVVSNSGAVLGLAKSDRILAQRAEVIALKMPLT